LNQAIKEILLLTKNIDIDNGLSGYQKKLEGKVLKMLA
jgi:hypothetical protein